MNQPRSTPVAEAGETLAELAYRRVCEAIGSGEFQPGQKITERGLADELAVSPTPVREAIRRLEQHGLITRIGPRTVVVADIAERTADDLIEVEVGLRGLVARFAARHARPEELDRLDAVSAQPLRYPYWHQAGTSSDRLGPADLTLLGRHLS